jgi:hypothetical protein
METMALSDVRPISTRSRWIGRALTALPVLFMAFDAAMKLAAIPPVIEAFLRMGLPPELAPAIGALELACLAVYVIPRTAPVGALLLTGFLGGAVALHVRLGDPLGSHTLFPVYCGALVWAGLFLRDARVRALVAANR